MRKFILIKTFAKANDLQKLGVLEAQSIRKLAAEQEEGPPAAARWAVCEGGRPRCMGGCMMGGGREGGARGA